MRRGYNYSGTFARFIFKFIQGLKNDPARSEKISWRLNWTHNQNITPTLRFECNC